ncbi:peptidase family C78-domain-containing protein [Russula dissimulans]|nr:peptidase family C78-domain-containing protein [Russula dissimulans]
MDPILVHDSEEDNEGVQMLASPHHGLIPEDRQRHYDNHLSAIDTLPPPSSGSRPLQQPSNAQSSPSKGISFFNPSAKEQFWHHTLGSDPPSNCTPGLIPLLRRSLLSSVEKGATHRAVLCYESVVHIFLEIWDAGWGCAYRNFMMLCTALVDQHIKPEYSSLIRDPTPPTVNNLKVWIEEAWKSGFDPDGAQKFKGKLVGRKKWIGTAELYVAFTYKGIPSQLADFDTPDGNVAPLLDWIRRYFDTHTEDRPTSVQERWRGASPVVISDRMPLILQHPGHSRTIVGYEIAKDGSTTLLAFDPSFRMMGIRREALSSFRLRNRRAAQPSDGTPSTSRRPAESPKKPLRFRNKRGGPMAAGKGESPPKRLRAGSAGDDVIVIEDSSAEAEGGPSNAVPEHGGSGDGVMVEGEEREEQEMGEDEDIDMSDPRKVLKLFRVRPKTLAKKSKYQVLWCPMEDPLTESDKQARREVTSDYIC